MSPKGKSSRHRGREVALQTLYAIDVARRPRPGALPSQELRQTEEAEGAAAEGAAAEGAAAERAGNESPASACEKALDPAAVFEGVAAHFEAPAGARDFAWTLVSEVCNRGPSLDEFISAQARNWRMSRMAAVDRNILRLGTYELAHTKTPAAVIMDEAVELARRFGSDSSPAFVNGILDALAKGLREGGA